MAGYMTVTIPLKNAVQHKEVYKTYSKKSDTTTTITEGRLLFGRNRSSTDPYSDYDYYDAELHFENIPSIKNYLWTNAVFVYNVEGNECKTYVKDSNYYTLSYYPYHEWLTAEYTLSNCAMQSYFYAGKECDASKVILNTGAGLTNPIRQKYIDEIIEGDGVTIKLFGRNDEAPSSNELKSYLSEFSDVSKVYLKITYTEIPLYIKNIYPINVYLKNNKAIKFEWESKLLYGSLASYQTKDSSEIYIAGHKLTVWNDAGTTKEYTLGGTVNSYQMSTDDVDDFGNGSVYYKVNATGSSQEISPIEGDTYSFVLLGESDAPDIVSISQDSFPVVTWECDDQISWQMVIGNGTLVLFDSGMVAGDDQSYKVPVFLEDGIYSIEMRALNEYGYYTPWNASTFTLNPTKPSAPTNIIVSANNDYSVYVDCTAPSNAGKLYVVRRENASSSIEVVGEWHKGFEDTNVALNKSYEYTVRHYKTGYKDGDWIDVTVNSPGVIIRELSNPSNIFKVWMAEKEFDVYKAEEKTDTLMQCVGRTYPVLELGEWITSTRQFSGCVSNAEFEQLLKIAKTNAGVILQNDNEVIHCYMQINDKGRHPSGNRSVEFVLTRIDGE